MHLASRDGISQLDVHQDVSPSLSTWGPGIAYSRLLHFEHGAAVDLPNLSVRCDICEYWDLLDDKTFVFTLRDDVRWHNIAPLNGRFLEAKDVAYSLERIRFRGWPNASLLHAVDDVVVQGKHTLQITLKAPDADFTIALADGHSKIVSKEAVDMEGHLENGPTIGTGPWILESSEYQTSHQFTRNEHYFQTDTGPFVDQLIIHVIPDIEAREAAFKVKLIDIYQMEGEKAAEFLASNQVNQHLTVLESGTGLEVAIKASRFPMDDPRVRKAFLLALDPDRAHKDIWKGLSAFTVAVPIADPSWMLSQAEWAPFFAQPEKAVELLNQSELPLPLPINITTSDYGAPYLSHVESMVPRLEAVGFKPTVEIVSRRHFGEKIWLEGDYQIMAGPPAPVVTPNGYLLSVVHSDGKWNTTEQKDWELDRLIEAQASEYNLATRGNLVRKIQMRMLEQSYRFMPATRVTLWAWQTHVHGFYPNFAGFEYHHWAGVWLQD